MGDVFARDSYLAALEPPLFDIGGGRVLVGRILSADDWFRFEDRLATQLRPRVHLGKRAISMAAELVRFGQFIAPRLIGMLRE